MKKSELVEVIIKHVKNVDCYINKVYGASNGVGYDLNIFIKWDNKTENRYKAHALHQSWACLGHLRPDNPFYKYSGHCDYYQEDVIKYWKNKNGFKEYLNRFTKTELEELLWTIEQKDGGRENA